MKPRILTRVTYGNAEMLGQFVARAGADDDPAFEEPRVRLLRFGPDVGKHEVGLAANVSDAEAVKLAVEELATLPFTATVRFKNSVSFNAASPAICA